MRNNTHEASSIYVQGIVPATSIALASVCENTSLVSGLGEPIQMLKPSVWTFSRGKEAIWSWIGPLRCIVYRAAHHLLWRQKLQQSLRRWFWCSSRRGGNCETTSCLGEDPKICDTATPSFSSELSFFVPNLCRRCSRT